jgi:hypothetical protein
MVHVTISPQQDKAIEALMTTRIEDDGSLPNCEKEIFIQGYKTMVICEPPLLGHYVRIEAKEQRLKLCEVEVFGTGNSMII